MDIFIKNLRLNIHDHFQKLKFKHLITISCLFFVNIIPYLMEPIDYLYYSAVSVLPSRRRCNIFLNACQVFPFNGCLLFLITTSKILLHWKISL